MCGSSAAQNNLEQQEAAFSQTLNADYSQTFAQNQEILNNLNSVLQPIVNAGPNQQGFSPEEVGTLNTQAIEGNAQAVNQGEQAAAQREDAAGGGTSFLPSGVNAQINAEIGSSAEANLSQEELGITQANYAQGRQNWQTALAGESGVATGESPLGYAGATTSANSGAFNEATQINQENNQWESDLLGFIPGIGSAISGGVANLDTTGGSTGGEQVENFLAGL